MSDTLKVDAMAMFEAAMFEAGYHKPERSTLSGDQYTYQRDQDRFVGWQLGRASLLKAAPSCATCNDSGIVGSAPDNYFDCRDCHKPDVPRPLTAEEHAVLRGAVMDSAEIVHHGKEAP